MLQQVNHLFLLEFQNQSNELLFLQSQELIYNYHVHHNQMTLDGFGETVEDSKERCARYARYIFECKKKLEEELIQKNQMSLMNEIEMPLMKVLAQMQYEGVLVDKEKLEEFGVSFGTEISQLMKDIYNLSGCEFNINSPKQLRRSTF